MKKEIVYLDIQDIWPIALVFIVTAIGVAFGLDITNKVQNDHAIKLCAARADSYTSWNATSETCVNGTGVNSVVVGDYQHNATTASMQGTQNITSKLPTIALVIVAAILIGILIRNLSMNG